MTRTVGFNTANKRYRRIFWPAMAIYVVTILTASYLIDTDTAPVWLKTVGAVAATLPVLATIWAIMRQTNETDEYTRSRQMKALADAGAGTVAIIFLIGFLQIFDVIGTFKVFWLGPVYFLWFGLAKCRALFEKTV